MGLILGLLYQTPFQADCSGVQNPIRANEGTYMTTTPLLKMLSFGRSTHQDLINQINYLTIENRILRSKIPKRISLTARGRRRLLRFGKPVGPTLRHIISIVQYTTFQRWIRGGKPPSSKKRKSKAGRPPTKRDLKMLVVQMAKTPGWGYSRILGELRKLGIHSISRTTVRSILKEHGIEPAPDRAEPVWDQFLKRHASTLWSCDFFTKKVRTTRGVKRHTTLVFMHIESRKVLFTKATQHPNNDWMCKVAECFPVMAEQLGLEPPGILVRDNDVLYTREFNATRRSEAIPTTDTGTAYERTYRAMDEITQG
jgi:putative transposase